MRITLQLCSISLCACAEMCIITFKRDARIKGMLSVCEEEVFNQIFQNVHTGDKKY